MKDVVSNARKTAESDGDDNGVVEATTAICLQELHEALCEEFDLDKNKQTPLLNGVCLLLSMASIDNGFTLKDVCTELTDKYTHYHMDALKERTEH